MIFDFAQITNGWSIIFQLISLVSIIIAITVHEASHAFAANYLGDPTPKLQKRLTLNPLAHLDMFGTLFIVLAGIGWGKPVEFNPNYLKNPKRDAAIVAFAGPLSNLLLASVVGLFIRFFNLNNIILFDLLWINVILAIFNLFPLEPLDGFKVVQGFLSHKLAIQWEETRKYGMYVLFFLLVTGAVSKAISPIAFFIVKILTGLRF